MMRASASSGTHSRTARRTSEIVDAPGQEIRRAATWTELHGEIASGKYRGIILVSANGYHALPGISFKDHNLYGGSKEKFLKAFLDNRRNEELTILRELTPHVKASAGKIWLFSLIAKQDLWWPERLEVAKQYQEGQYSTEINAIINHLGQRQFRHELAFTSLVLRIAETITSVPNVSRIIFVAPEASE